jgi:hypothetical protein
MSRTYLSNRDRYRQQVFDHLNQVNPTPTYWSDASFKLAATSIKHIAKGASYNFVIRILLDWHMTGRNKLKQTVDPQNDLDVGECLLCHAPP